MNSVCPLCGTEVIRRAHQRGRRRIYCSRACQERAKTARVVAKKRVERTESRSAMVCLTCGISLAERRAEKYCSLACANRNSDRFHRRRVLKTAAHTGTPVSFQKIAEADGWLCYLCHELVDPTIKGPSNEAASLDHVIPLAKGGIHDPSNLRLAHLGCNRRKATKTLEELQR